MATVGPLVAMPRRMWGMNHAASPSAKIHALTTKKRKTVSNQHELVYELRAGGRT
jgi:hypothetical protein